MGLTRMPILSANEYQKLACVTESPRQVVSREDNGHWRTEQYAKQLNRLLHSAVGCCTEAGELQDALKRELFYGKSFDATNLCEEYGDLLWYVAIGLDALGVSMEDCMERNIAKLQARYPSKFDAHRAVNRDLAAERKALEEKPAPPGEPFPLPPINPLDELDEGN